LPIPSDPLKNVILREEDRPLADDPDESKDPYGIENFQYRDSCCLKL